MLLSAVVSLSHDRLTRLLYHRYPWHQLLSTLASSKRLTEGCLIIDDTEIDKSYAQKITGCGWLRSHKQNKYFYGLHVVVLAWTNGKQTLPLAWKVYKKGGEKTKIDLALELLGYGLLLLRGKPKAVLFDAFYASERMLKFLTKRGVMFYSQLPKTRLFNHRQLNTRHQGRPYWADKGIIKGSLEVQVVKHRRKYYVTNNLGVNQMTVRGDYRLRWKIEEVFRFIKQELGFEQCQDEKFNGAV